MKTCTNIIELKKTSTFYFIIRGCWFFNLSIMKVLQEAVLLVYGKNVARKQQSIVHE